MKHSPTEDNDLLWKGYGVWRITCLKISMGNEDGASRALTKSYQVTRGSNFAIQVLVTIWNKIY